jgi:hypothetical protein
MGSSLILGSGAVSILWTGIKADFCPERTIGLSLGCQPQVSIKYVSRPERATEAFPQVMGRRQINNRSKNLAPLQGASRVGVSLRLKPQAESYSPFGTKSSMQPKYSSTKSKPLHSTPTSTKRKR